MIENLKYDEKTVSWNTKSGKRVEKIHNSISNVLTNSKEVYVLYRENDRDDVVIVYSGEGELLGELHNTDVMYINYLQNHPRYGVVIIISEKINEKFSFVFMFLPLIGEGLSVGLECMRDGLLDFILD